MTMRVNVSDPKNSDLHTEVSPGDMFCLTDPSGCTAASSFFLTCENIHTYVYAWLNTKIAVLSHPTICVYISMQVIVYIRT